MMAFYLCLIVAALVVLGELLSEFAEYRRRRKRKSTPPMRSVPRCPVCGRLSPYGLCPNGHAGQVWHDEPYE